MWNSDESESEDETKLKKEFDDVWENSNFFFFLIFCLKDFIK